MVTVRRVTLCVAFALAVGACSVAEPREFAEQFLPAEALGLPVDFAALIRDQDFDSARGLMAASLRAEVGDSVWLEVGDILQGFDQGQARLLGVNVNLAEGVATAALRFEAPASNGWVVFDATIEDDRVAGFYARTVPGSLVELNEFGYADLSVGRVLVLLWGLASFAFAFGVAVVVVRSDLRFRWLWAPACFLVAGRVGLNWTTGAVTWQPIYLSAPPLGFLKAGLAAPWMFSVGLPVFAIAALVRVRRARATNSVSDEGGEGLAEGSGA